MINTQVFIHGQIPSLKNSKIKTSKGIFPSRTVLKWLRLYGIQSYSSSKKTVKLFKTIKGEYDFEELCKPLKLWEEEYPIKLGFHFVRNSKRIWDFNNANHIITDLMTAFDIIEDDDVKHILPFPMKMNGEYWSYSKEDAGVFIKVL